MKKPKAMKKPIPTSAPLLPKFFTTEWLIVAGFNTTVYPYHWNPYPPTRNNKYTKYEAGTGRTYYDSEKQYMLEVYDQFCVPIFEKDSYPYNSNWPCKFLNVDFVSYLISPKPSSSPFPECCVFGEKVFHPPHRGFLNENHVPYNSTTTIFNEPIDWWVIDHQGPDQDPAEPFGYGFYQNVFVADGSRQPAAFWFRTSGISETKRDAFTIQYFRNMTISRPSDDVWKIPKSCVNAPNCGFL
ncbi:hypothetical protein ABK040_012287 [Willaertia magna]